MRKILLMAMCLVAALSASATDVFYISDFTINPGETKEIEINLDNDSIYTALQADIYLPEGLTIEQEDGDYLFELTDRKGRNHTISSTMLSSGAIRILIASQTLKTFSGNSGALVTFPIIADNTFSGTMTIEMKNIIVTDDEQTLHYFPNQTTIVTQEGYVPPTGEADCLYISDFSINAGETKEIEINLDNDSVYTALQADIYLPEGLTIEQEDGDYLFELTDRKGRDHTISSTMLSSGAIRILIASQTLKTFSGNSGALVTFPIIADNTFSGTKTIEMKNVIATDNEQTLHYFPNNTCTITGNGSTPEPTLVTSLVTTSCEIPQGIRVKFNEGVNPSDAENQALAWTSSNNSIATVAQDGTIETLEMGTVTITATTTDGSNIALNYVINVTEAQTQQTGNPLDVNGDGYVTATDVTVIYNYLLFGNPTPSDHEYVDLGLPSGTLWATMNVGASTPEDYGDYFAWGETTTRDVYNWSTYKWCNGNYNTLTKYCTLSSYGYNGFTDDKTELDPEDDAAYVNWGPKWRIPTKDQQDELRAECTWQWTTRNGVNGYLVTSNHNGASMFMPAAGYRWNSSLGGTGTDGCYRSRTLDSSTPNISYSLDFNSEVVECYNSSRGAGRSVRAVRVSQK